MNKYMKPIEVQNIQCLHLFNDGYLYCIFFESLTFCLLEKESVITND